MFLNNAAVRPKRVYERHARVNSERPGRCYMIGLEPNEIAWVRLLLKLLRDADPLPPELARQALEYVETVAHAAAAAEPQRPAMRL